MSALWYSQTPPEEKPITPVGWLWVIMGCSLLFLIAVIGLIILVILRPIERLFVGTRRPMSSRLVQGVCRLSLLVFRLRLRVVGRPMVHSGGVVANHSSWLDIFALNALDRVFFVAKSEVAGWPGIGILARAAGTVFIRRAASDALKQKQIFEERLSSGDRLLFFPEGTSTDGLQVLQFKSSLYQAFFTSGKQEETWIQPVSLTYDAPRGEAAHFYGWWGDMDFARHLFKVLALARPGIVRIVYHAPLRVADYGDRKALAKACENLVRAGINPDN